MSDPVELVAWPGENACFDIVVDEEYRKLATESSLPNPPRKVYIESVQELEQLVSSGDIISFNPPTVIVDQTAVDVDSIVDVLDEIACLLDSDFLNKNPSF